MTAALTQAPKASVDLDALYAASNIGEILDQLDRELVGLVPVRRATCRTPAPPARAYWIRRT